MTSRASRRRLLAPQLVVARDLQESRQRLLVRAAVVDVARGRGPRQLVGTHEVAPADLGGIQTEIARDLIEPALGHGGADRVTARSPLRGRALVLAQHTQLVL